MRRHIFVVSLLSLLSPTLVHAALAVQFDSASGSYSISSDGGDDIVVGCGIGNQPSVLINGAIVGAPVACAGVVRFRVDGGPEANRIDLSATATGFTNLIETRLHGAGGADTIIGSPRSDTILGGPGDDRLDGSDGDDTLVWNNGDGTDVFEGGAGSDTAEVNGAAAGEQYRIAQNGPRAQLNRLSPGPFGIDIGACERLVVNTLDGADVVDTEGLLALSQRLDGGNPTEFPGDVLTVRGLPQTPATSPIVPPSGAAIAHLNFEFAPQAALARDVDSLSLWALLLLVGMVLAPVAARRH